MNLLPLLLAAAAAAPAPRALQEEADRRVKAVLPRIVEWRRDFHQHPELGNRETRTSARVAEHLRALGLEVQTGVARTGVVALVRGGRPGPVVALRADMDGLPVTEETAVPFKSTVKTEWRGQQVGVMHACGHDTHTAILMGVAEVLAGMKERLPGTVKLIFQPAEEGPPPGEEGGAPLMTREGVLENPKVDAIFALHVWAPLQVGVIGWRPRGLLAASDMMEIRVRGRQTHGAMPWRGVDPVVAASHIVVALQAIVSRQAEITRAPAVVTIGSIHGGNRHNIIPDEVLMAGTVRTFDPGMQRQIHEHIRRTVTSVAEAAGATAEVTFTQPSPVTFNDPDLTARMEGTLRRVGGTRILPDMPPVTVSEDFAAFQQKVPGLYFFVGATPEGTDPATAEPNHSPRFFVDEGALEVG
ncbi:MAG TPA: amidohydrolase, partial [Vicinamibacteria bacterium]|nr:amidohydrolase [Vicinamibacteria bacterium]